MTRKSRQGSKVLIFKYPLTRTAFSQKQSEPCRMGGQHQKPDVNSLLWGIKQDEPPASQQSPLQVREKGEVSPDKALSRIKENSIKQKFVVQGKLLSKVVPSNP